MGTGRKFHKKPVTRPKKSLAERARRAKIHQDRLVELGADREKVAKMTYKDVRDLLKYPKKTAAQFAKAKERAAIA